MRFRDLFIWAVIAACCGMSVQLGSAQPPETKKSTNEKKLEPQDRGRSSSDKPFFANRPGTTVQLPTFGVAIDAAGLMSWKAFPDPGGRLHRKRVEVARAALPADVQRQSELRIVSLRRLQAAIERRLQAGQPIDSLMRNLAGLQRLQYVFVLPRENDILVGGPAEGFCADAAGRSVGLTSGLPTLQLEDWCVALRAFAAHRPLQQFIGCTIDPTQEGLARLRTFQATIPRVVSDRDRARVAQYVAQGTRDSLGMSPIRVFGVSPKTRFAQVLVECDYRMKLIGIGVEPAPVKMTTFLGALRRPDDRTLQRWWFTPFYDTLKLTDDRLGIEFRGQGVQLRSEDKIIDREGRLRDTGRPVSKPNKVFADGFTRKYEDIARQAPVFAHMRNLIDMTVAAAFLRKFDGYGRAGWQPTTLLNEELLPVQVLPAPQQVPAAVNSVWKGRRLLSPAGGVSIQPALALEQGNYQEDDDGVLDEQRRRQRRPADAWWWDADVKPGR